MNTLPSVHIVIGKNFGDEGKGLATDYFALNAREKDMPCLVIRHNGGAQAGHTVDLKYLPAGTGKPAGTRSEICTDRFVFHQLSSGSFRDADTLWADTFLPDLYKLPEELEDFMAAAGNSHPLPVIYASPSCRCVCIDDVLLNMAAETMRGSARHGSCGMGIYEAVVRSESFAFRISLSDVCGSSAQALYRKLKRIREEYLPLRLSQLKMDSLLQDAGEYGELLSGDNVLFGAAEGMCRGAEHICLTDPGQILPHYGEIIFEGAQGLLLDENNKEYLPHLTASSTGLRNPVRFMKQFPAVFSDPSAPAPEAVYVSRTYVTRHGAGPLPLEKQFDHSQFRISDPTNQPNDWQGALRFAPHPGTDAFLRPVLRDLEAAEDLRICPALFLTHLQETGGKICTEKGMQQLQAWLGELCSRQVFEKMYLAGSRFAQDCTAHSYKNC